METYQDSQLEVDYNARRVVMNHTSVHLTPSEFRLLAMLCQNAGSIVQRPDLLRDVCGCSPEARSRSLDVHLRRLRFKLGDDRRQHIQTVFGVGYRLRPFAEDVKDASLESAEAIGPRELPNGVNENQFISLPSHYC